jgi:hypothetical protein
MAKAFSTFTVLQGKEPLLRRMVCEVRYQDGQLYLDHSGRLLRRLMKEAPEWILGANPTAQGTNLYNVQTGSLLGFTMNSASLSLDKTSADEVIGPEEIEAFLGQVDSTLGLVLDELEVTEFNRIGYRDLYYFSCDNKEESEKWLMNLGLVSVPPGVSQAFSSTLEGLGVTLAMQGPECHYRVGLNSMERAAQIPVSDAVLSIQPSVAPRPQRKALMESLKVRRQRQINSAFAVVLDIDAFLLDPEEPDIHGFVEERVKTNLEYFREALRKDTPKKGK